MDSVNNVCRVCLTADNLTWVFDPKLHCVQMMNLKDVILTTTGVEILTEDIISQKICTRCYRTSINMYYFRIKARKNNNILKERYDRLLKTLSMEHEIPKAEIGVTMEKRVEPEMKIKEVIESNHRIHRSVIDLFKKFPRLKLPSPCLSYNIEPCIILERDTVETFLKKEIKNKQINGSLSKTDHIIAEGNTSPAAFVTDPLHISSLPIISTETNSGEQIVGKKIIENNSIVSEIVGDNSNNGDSEYELNVIDNITVEPKIRRHTDSELSDTKMDSSSSGPVPREKPIGEFAEGLCIDKSIPLLVCSICNSVHENVKKLERHQLRHLRCQFCSSMFKTIRSMETHMNSSCTIKNMMNSLPSVKLERIELNQRMRTKYPGAFIDYPSTPKLQLMPRSPDETTECEVSVKDKKTLGSNDGDGVIEVLSDDDITSPPGNCISSNTSVHKKEIVPVRNITQSKIKSFFLATNSTTTERAPSTVPSIMSTSSSVISTTRPASSIASSVVSANSPIIPSRLSSAHIVEPDIRIGNSSVVDRITPGLWETEYIKKVITDSSALNKEGFSHTDLSCSSSIASSVVSANSAIISTRISSGYIVEPDIRIDNSSVVDRITPGLRETESVKKVLTDSTALKKEELFHTDSSCGTSICATNSTTTERAPSTVPSVMSTPSSVISTTRPVSYIASPVVSATSPVISRRLRSAYIVEPDIRIYNSTVVDRISPGLREMQSIKKVLTDSSALRKEGFSQTDLSRSTSICVNESDGIIELKNMRDLLVLYRIAFSFEKGDFQARYDHNSINSKPQQPNKLCLWNDLIPVDIEDVSGYSTNEVSVQDRIPVITSEVATESYSIPGITDNCTETKINPLEFSFSPVKNLRTYSRNNCFSTPVTSSSGSPKVNVHHQVVTQDSGIINEDPCSKNLKHIFVKTNSAKQQSNTNTVNSPTASYVQMYPESVSTTHLQSNCLVAIDPIPVHPEADIAVLQTTPIFSSIDDMRSPPVNPFGIQDLTIPTTSCLASPISKDNASNVSFADSLRYNPPYYLIAPEPVPNTVPITIEPSSNEAGPGLGGIRVRSLRDLT